MLELAKLGQVKMVMHRQLKGTPKTAVVKRTPTGVNADVIMRRNNFDPPSFSLRG
jgi:hypothetical protein